MLGGYITTNALVRNTKVIQLSYILKQKSGRKNVETYACMLLFILCTSVSNESLDTKHLTQAILGSSILFSLYGLAQRCGFFASPTAYFPMTGSFDNPAGLGMFLAISFPYALSQYQYGWTNRLIVFLIGLTLLLTESRTSILAAAVAATIYFSHKLSSRWQRALLLSIGLLFVGLYFYKPLSANGRLFISYITARLVHGHFLTGNGPFSFETEYMMEQARYFVAHPTSSYIQLADNITQPFNEYLHLFIRFGFMGLVLLSAIAWMTLSKDANLRYTPQTSSLGLVMCRGCMCLFLLSVSLPGNLGTVDTFIIKHLYPNSLSGTCSNQIQGFFCLSHCLLRVIPVNHSSPIRTAKNQSGRTCCKR